MTNSVTGSTQVLPNTATTPDANAQPAGLPLVAGGGSPVTGTQPSIVDQALADVLGTSVVGGGTDAPSSDPAAGIPGFVRRFLPVETGVPTPGAIEGFEQQSAPQKGASSGQQIQQGWAWLGCAPQSPPRPTYPPHVPSWPTYPSGPPSKGGMPMPPVDQVPPGKGGVLPPQPGAGELPPPPPGKGDVPPPPVDQVPPPAKGKGEPPAKGDPPAKVDAPTKVEQTGGSRGTHTVGKGEYLSAIAPEYGITWKQLFWANRDQIKHPDLIHPGQVLTIPPKDLEVPDFEYNAMFTGPGKSYTKGTHTPGSKDSPPAKDAPGKPVSGPPPAPPTDSSATPPGPNNSGGKLPDAPPVPDTSSLPPALP